MVAIISQTLVVLQHEITELNTDLLENQLLKGSLLSKGVYKPQGYQFLKFKMQKQMYVFFPSGISDHF